MLLAGFLAPLHPAELTNSSASRAVELAERAYTSAQEAFQKNPTNAEIAWTYGRTCFDLAEFAGQDSYRGQLADQGMEACRTSLRINPVSAAAHYYLALNMGQKARTEKLGALKLVSQMEKELKDAIAVDPKLDYGGPDRSLGLLYKDAPGWPMSIGSNRKAREHLLAATLLAPDYPDNWLSLLDAYLEWNDKSKARELLLKVSEKLKAARQKLTGPEWEWSWQDWQRRWEKIKEKLDYKEPQVEK
jgi:tetratricopeptide (TPR) repeat protein